MGRDWTFDALAAAVRAALPAAAAATAAEEEAGGGGGRGLMATRAVKLPPLPARACHRDPARVRLLHEAPTSILW